MRKARIVRLVLIVFVLGLGAFRPQAAPAADIQVLIGREALQRFFQAAAPFTYNYELFKGQTAASITISDPKVIIEPGDPGRVFVEMKYQGESPLLGLPAFTGQARPEVGFGFDPERGVMLLQLREFQIQAGDKLKVRLDSLIKPIPLALAPAEPIKMQKKSLKINAASARTRVVADGILIEADYRFAPVETQP